MSIYPDKTINEVLGKLEMKSVLGLINYRQDTLQETEDSIKCFCPIHKETVFRTLIIIKNDKTYRCSYSFCAGSKGGDLISLYARSIGKDYDEAIPLLVKELALDVELPTTQEFIDKTLEVAENYLELGVLDEAEKGFRKVTDVQQTNLAAHKGLMEVYALLNDEEKTAEEMRILISLLIESKQFGEASDFCKKLLEKRPEDVEIRNALIQCHVGVEDYQNALGESMNLADLYEIRENFEAALDVYRKVESLNTDLIDVHPHIVQALVALNRTQEAIDETIERAQSFLDAKEFDKALQAYRSILELDEGRNDIRLAYINTALQTGLTAETTAGCLAVVDEMLAQESFPDAIAALNSLMLHNPTDAQTIKKLIEVYDRQGKEEDERALQLRLAQLYNSQGNVHAAVETLHGILATAPHCIEALQLLTATYRSSGSLAEARTALLNLATALENEKRLADAISTYDTLIELAPSEIQLREKQIQLHLTDGQIPVALQKCKSIIAFLLKEGKIRGAIEKIRFALTFQADSTDLLAQLAELLAGQHDIEEAKKAYLQAYEVFFLNDNIEQAAARLLNILELDNDDVNALSALADLYASSGDSVKALKNYRRLATILHNRQDWKACESILKKILELQPEDISTLNQLAKIYQSLQENENLVKTYQQLTAIYFKKEAYSKIIELSNATLKLFPSDVEAHQNLVRVYEATGKIPVAIEHLFHLSEIYKALNDLENEQQVYESVLGLDKTNLLARKKIIFLLLETNQRQRSFAETNMLVDQYCELDNLNEASALLKRLLEFEPEHVPFHQRLIGILKQQNKAPDLIAQIKKLIVIQKATRQLDDVVNLTRELLHHEPNNLSYRHDLVETLMQLQKTEDAISEYLLIAELHISLSNFDEAEATYLKIIDLDPTNERVFEKVIEFYEKRGMLAQATAQSLALSKLQEEQGNVPKAIATLRHVLTYDRNNMEIRRSIITLDKEIDNVKDALREYVALFSYYRESNSFDAAVEVQKEAIAYQPANVDLRRALIDAYVERGEKGPAVAELFDLITLYANQEHFDASIAAADEILVLQPQNFKARKVKAEIFMKMGNEKKALEEFVQLSNALEQAPPQEPPPARSQAPREEPHLAIVKEHLFDSFVVGEGNNFAHATALAVAKSPAQVYNPLFLYSDVGLGKTHLMHAIANFILQNRPELRILYTNTEEFTSALVDAIQNNTIIAFRQRHKNIDVLLLDDVQFLAGKEGAQEEFFHIFNTLFQAKKQIVVTSDRPPKDIAHLEKRLKSRFRAGVIVDIQPPGIETRLAILNREAMIYSDVKISDEIVNLIAERIETNVRELKGALNQIVAVHRFTKEPITPEMVSQLLDRLFEKV